MNATGKVTFVFLLTRLTEAISLYSGSLNCPENCKCNFTSSRVDCSGLGLNVVPALDLLQIKELDMSDNLLTKFPEELSKIESLEYLNLRGNEISKLTPTSLRGFLNLKVLILDQNCVRNWDDIIPYKFLLPAESLHTLSLADNPLVVNSVNEQSYLRSSSLTNLNLSRTQITNEGLLYIFKSLPNIKQITLSNTLITELPNIQMEKLEYLDVSSTRLTHIDLGAFNLSSNLKNINLSSNPGFSFIYHNEKIYPQIEELDISNCGMVSIDTTNFPNLQSLVIKGNVIQNISRCIFYNSKSIKNMDLSDNAIQQLDSDSFATLKQLEVLDLSNNKIQNVNLNVFIENTALSSLDLSGNPTIKVNGTTPQSLKKLNMSRCRLYQLKKDIFNNMTNLELLDLSNNFLPDFPSTVNFVGLRYLDLSLNRLSGISWSTFLQCVNLEVLKLNGNRFTTPFHRRNFVNNTKLTEIFVGDNPFKCNCSDPNFEDFYKFMTEHPRKIQDKLRCDKPAGLTWETVCPNFYTKLLSSGSFLVMIAGVILLATAFLLIWYRKKIFKSINCACLKRKYSTVPFANEERNNIDNTCMEERNVAMEVLQKVKEYFRKI